VVGDIHGHFKDLLTILNISGLPSASNAYLFNGDFVDRGTHSLECIILLLTLKLLCPGSVFMNR
jgi:AAA15 family ATPase/GTPase